jgi:threonine/homoserine/homoserine lactone efflux protein
MTDLQQLSSLLVFAAIATMTPGGATVLVASSGARFGFRNSIPLLVGTTSGVSGLCAGAAAGLGILVQAVPELELTVRTLGTGYLLWLGWRIANAGSPHAAEGAAHKPVGLVGGVLLLVLNPKAWATAIGAAATFASMSASPAELALLMGGVFGCFAILSLSLWCAVGTFLAKALTTEWQWRVLNSVLGLTLAASVSYMWI